jgi:hypothetical protein
MLPGLVGNPSPRYPCEHSSNVSTESMQLHVCRHV